MLTAFVVFQFTLFETAMSRQAALINTVLHQSYAGSTANELRTAALESHYVLRYVHNGFTAAIAMGLLSAIYITGFTVTATRARRYKLSALQDGLTNVQNRRGAIATLERHIAAGIPFGIVFLDLDGFKKINDSFGHAAGDAILKVLASRLTVGLRESDTVCRIGGDEFICVIAPLDEPRCIQTIAARLLQAVTRPYSVEGDDFILGCSAGISIHPIDGTTVDGLLANADRAMYEAKALGGGIHFESNKETPSRYRRS